jgi:hypothetical protein
MTKSNKGGALNVWSRFALIIPFVLLGAGAEAQDRQADKKSAAEAVDQVTYGALRGGVTSVLVPQRLADDKALQKKIRPRSQGPNLCEYARPLPSNG